MEVKQNVVNKNKRFFQGVIGCGALASAFAASWTIISPSNAIMISAVVFVLYVFIFLLVKRFGYTVKDEHSRKTIKYSRLKSGYHFYMAGVICVLLFPAVFPEKNTNFVSSPNEQIILAEIPHFDTSTFSILILQFNNRGRSRSEHDIIGIIKTRFLSLAAIEKLNIEVDVYPVYVDFSDTTRLEEIADSSNASLLLHGDYLVFSDDSIQTSIHYFLNKELPNTNLKSEFTSSRTIGIHEIFMGKSLEEIDNVIYFHFAQIEFSLRSWLSSIKFFEKIKDQYWRKQPEKYIPLGYCYIKLSDTMAAIDAYNESLKFKATAAALGNLALIENMKGNEAASMSLYRQALNVDSLHFRTMVNFGIALYELGKFDSSKQTLLQVVKKTPDQSVKHDALCALGTLCERMSDTLLAVQFYQKSIRVRDNQFRSNFNLCRLYWRLDKIDSAEVYVDRALEIDSTNASAQIIKGLVVMKLVRKNILIGQKFYKKSTEQNPHWKNDVYDEIFMIQ